MSQKSSQRFAAGSTLAAFIVLQRADALERGSASNHTGRADHADLGSLSESLEQNRRSNRQV